MVDFKNGAVIKLSKTKNFVHEDVVRPLFISDEEFIGEYQAIRDYVIFTNKRIISVNVQGLTGKKKDFTTLPYSKIQAFSVETSGVLDLDSELELYFSGLGKVKFEFTSGSDIVTLGKLISEKILQIVKNSPYRTANTVRGKESHCSVAFRIKNITIREFCQIKEG